MTIFFKGHSNCDTDVGLDASYTYERPESFPQHSVTAIVHGVCHTRECFDNLVPNFIQKGIGVVRVQLSSGFDTKKRNWTGVKEYTDGLKWALEQFEKDNDVRIGSIAGHSMGGRLVQQLQNTDPEWRRPTILMAPVPLHGTLPMLARMTVTHPVMLAKTLNAELRNAMQSDNELRTLFGDEESTPETIDTIRTQLQHTSFAAYLALLSPQRILPEARQHPVLLMQSQSDNLFPPHTNSRLIDIYEDIETQMLHGGHDFFIQHAQETVDAYASFHLRYCQPLA